MTETQYVAIVTGLIAEITGPDFEFPESSDDDIRACFLRRNEPSEAAAKLAADWVDS